MGKYTIGRTINEFKVGMTREFSKVFTEEDTRLMGELIGDHNPFHFNEKFVKKTRFKRTYGI